MAWAGGDAEAEAVARGEYEVQAFVRGPKPLPTAPRIARTRSPRTTTFRLTCTGASDRELLGIKTVGLTEQKEVEHVGRKNDRSRRSHQTPGAAFDMEAGQYDRWFESRKGKAIFDIERNCLRALMQTDTGLWLEVGVGSGRFATSLGISQGVDPSLGMLTIAARRGIYVVRGMGEDLPYQDAAFDGILMVTTLCFLLDPKKTLAECHRVLRSRGTLVVGIVPAEGTWGLLYRARGREGHSLYSKAKFYKCSDVERFCADAGFFFLRGISGLRTPPGEKPVPSLEEGICESAGFVAMLFCKA